MNTYNGWTNYETWVVKLWLDNDYGTYLEVTRKAEEFYDNSLEDGNPSEDGAYNAHYEFADWLKEYMEELREALFPDETASVFTDLLNAALSEVNWTEMSESYLSDAKENADE